MKLPMSRWYASIVMGDARRSVSSQMENSCSASRAVWGVLMPGKVALRR
jgi:hypothetical protein